MKTKLLLLLLGWAGLVWGQVKDKKATVKKIAVKESVIQKVSDKSVFSIVFKNDTIKTEKSSKEDYINIPLKINLLDAKDWEGYKLKIEVDQSKTTLPATDYQLVDSNFNFTELGSESIVNIILKKDTIDDRDRFIFLNLKTVKDTTDVGKRNIGANKKVVIVIKSSSKKYHIDDYKILSYVGTNFDIVEGKTKAKNLFFAQNIFHPPNKNKHNVGFYFSLYGNRTMSDVDSTGNVNRTYKIESINNGTAHILYKSQNKMTVTRISDNIGVHISPLFKLIKSSNEKLNLHYAPSLEFIWRQSKITREYTNPSNLETTTVYTPFPGTITMDNISRKIQNEYAFNVGLVGLFLVYETKEFSFRIQASTGYSTYFYPSNSILLDDESEIGRKSDVFFLGRAWMTEAKTGITLQTEIMNTAINPRPFFGVTLSKAFKLEDLGAILKPLTSR